MRGRVRTTAILITLLSAAPASAQQGRRQIPPVPEGVEARLDVPYADTEHPRQRLDLYLPEERAGDQLLPVIAFIHGGVWRAGD